MMKRFGQIVSFLLIVCSAHAQTSVADYSFGEYGTERYEHFSFWVKSNRRSEVTYAYGVDRTEVKLIYAGKTIRNGKTGFVMRFPNKYILYVVPAGSRLQISDAAGNYNKMFNWEYEGPVNGIGTFCDACAQNEMQAMHLIQMAYLK